MFRRAYGTHIILAEYPATEVEAIVRGPSGTLKPSVGKRFRSRWGRLNCSGLLP